MVKNYKIKENKIIITPVTLSKKSQQEFLQAKKNTSLRKKIAGKKSKVVLSVGRLVSAKDFPNLINAVKIVVKKFSDVIFVIVGTLSNKE